MPAATTLRIAIGDYPHTLPLNRGEIVSPWLSLDFVEAKPMHTAFKPMVREHAFDASEMALATYLQAVAYKKGLKLLPAAMLARFQHGTVLYNSERGVLGPNDLAGKRIGVRSYSQTTGVWMRGILQNDYAVDLSGVTWVTFEDGHVAEAKEPAGVVRAERMLSRVLPVALPQPTSAPAVMPSASMLKMLLPLRPSGDAGALPVQLHEAFDTSA